jgi:hypothetical protein
MFTYCLLLFGLTPRENSEVTDKYSYIVITVNDHSLSYYNMHACLRPLLSNGPSQQVNSGDAC